MSASSNVSRLLPERTVTQVAVIVLVSVAVYANSLWGSFQYDDFWDIHYNPLTASLSDIAKAFPVQRWLVYFSFLVDRQLYGLDFLPGWHITNILLHISTALALFWLIRLLYGQRESAYPIAFVAALIFAVHPLATEPVNYIRARTATFYALFAILAACGAILCCQARAWRTKIAGAVLTAVCVTMAALSKEVGGLFAAGLIGLYFLIYVRLSRRQLALVGAMFLALASSLVWWFHATGVLLLFSRLSGNRILGTHLCGYTTVFWRYVALALFPHTSRLSVDHHIPYPPNRWYGLTDADVGLSVIGLCVLVAAVWVLRRRSKPAAFLLGMMPLCLVPYFFIVTVDLLVEYKFYLPLAGFCALAAILLDLVRRKSPKAFAVSIAVIMLFSAACTVTRNRVWQTNLSLWQDAYEKAPRRARTMNAYALALACDPNDRDLDRSLALALRSFDRNYVDVWPGFSPHMVDTVAQIHCLRGDIDQAIRIERELVQRGEGIVPYFQGHVERFEQIRREMMERPATGLQPVVSTTESGESEPAGPWSRAYTRQGGRTLLVVEPENRCDTLGGDNDVR